MLLRTVLVVAVMAALAGCGSSHPAAPKSSLPPGCSTADADNIIADFLVNPVVAPPGFFTTLSVTDPDGRHFVTHSGPAAVKFLRARLKVGENDRMLSLAVAPIDFNHVAVFAEVIDRLNQEELHAPMFAAGQGEIEIRGLGFAAHWPTYGESKGPK